MGTIPLAEQLLIYHSASAYEKRAFPVLYVTCSMNSVRGRPLVRSPWFDAIVRPRITTGFEIRLPLSGLISTLTTPYPVPDSMPHLALAAQRFG